MIEFRQGVAVRIDLPANLLKVLDQLLAPKINQQTMLTGMIAQHGVHAVDSILHRRIGAWNSGVGTIAVLVTAKKIFHDLPVGATAYSGLGCEEHDPPGLARLRTSTVSSYSVLVVVRILLLLLGLRLCSIQITSAVVRNFDVPSPRSITTR